MDEHTDELMVTITLDEYRELVSEKARLWSHVLELTRRLDEMEERAGE